MANQNNQITLTAALSPQYTAAFKAAADEARMLGNTLGVLEKKEESLKQLQFLRSKAMQQNAAGDIKAAQKTNAEFDRMAKKLGITDKSAEGLDNELKKINADLTKTRNLKAALDQKAEISRTAASVQRLQRSYDTLKDPKIGKVLNDQKNKLKALGVSIDSNNGVACKFSVLKGNIKNSVATMIQSNGAASSLSAMFGGLSLTTMAAVAGFAALAMGAFKAKSVLNDLAKSVITEGDELAKQTAALGINAESYQKLQYAMMRNGATQQEFDTSLKQLLKTSESAIEGNRESQKAFSELGITMADLKKDNPEELFYKLADGFKKIDDPAKRFKIAQKTIGMNGLRMASALSAGSEEIIKLGIEGEKLGFVIKNDMLAQMEAGADATLNAQLAIEGFKRQLGLAAAPSEIERQKAIADALTRNADAVQILSNFSRDFSTVLDKVVVGAIDNAAAVIKIWDLGTKNLGNTLYVLINKTLPEVKDNIFSFISDIYGDVKGFVDYVLNIPKTVGETLGRGVFDLKQSIFGEEEPLVRRAEDIIKPSNVRYSITNNIDARGAQAGVSYEVGRAISTGNKKALENLQAAQNEQKYIQFAGGY